MSRFDARWLLIFDDGRSRKEAFLAADSPPPPVDWTLSPEAAAIEARYGLQGIWHQLDINITLRMASYGRKKEAAPA